MYIYIYIVDSFLFFFFFFFAQDVGSCIVDWNPETAAQIYQAHCELLFEQLQNPEMLDGIEDQADGFVPASNANQDAPELVCPGVDR